MHSIGLRRIPKSLLGARPYAAFASVAHVVNLVANGMTPAQIVEELPDLEEDDGRQALAYAAALARS